jgi:hypothetical protein
MWRGGFVDGDWFASFFIPSGLRICEDVLQTTAAGCGGGDSGFDDSYQYLRDDKRESNSCQYR